MSAWEFYRDTRGRYGERFSGWLYQEYVKETKKLNHCDSGIFWLLSKPEQEAIEIMDRFCLEQMETT